MAQLPGGCYLIQQIDDTVILFERDTGDEIVRFIASDQSDAARAQKTIYGSEFLTDEQKVFAHFWSGYFYAHATIHLYDDDRF